MKNTVYLIAFGIFLFFYFRWFEKKLIYYPTRTIEFTPQEINLSFEDIYFNTSDSVKLNGWFIPAENPKATLIFCHGNGGNIGDRLHSLSIFNRLGLNVFIFDYRGYGRSGGRPFEEGTYLDAKAAYDYLVKREDVDRSKILVYGESLGGAIAYELAIESKVNAVITLGTFSSILDMCRAIYPFFPVRLIVRTEYDTISKVKKVKVPKLIIHSADDEIVPFGQGKKLFSHASEPKEFYEMHGGHNDTIFVYEKEFCQKISDFLNKIHPRPFPPPILLPPLLKGEQGGLKFQKQVYPGKGEPKWVKEP